MEDVRGPGEGFLVALEGGAAIGGGGVKRLRAIDVCCGAGGWAVAARGLPVDVVAAFDREQDCLDTYKLNHPATECVLCDVQTYDFSPWRGVDLILGGIPCEQITSFRNNNTADWVELEGFKTLLGRMLAIPAELSAPLFCYEEVVQVKHYLPAGTPFIDLSSKSYSGQDRRRLYIGLSKPPAPGNCSDLLRDFLRGGPHRISRRILGKRRADACGKGPDMFRPFLPDKKCLTVTTMADSRRDHEAATPHPLGWRNLEWQELASLQGFPADYLFAGNPGRVSKMIGQAVQADTGHAILAELLKGVGC